MNEVNGYRYSEQSNPPEATRVTDVAITRFEHVFEVDPRLMQRWVLQQTFPNWDTLRIMNARHDHLDWMHKHFAEKTLSGSELLAEVDAEERSP
jgi:RPA family protein